MKKLRFVCIVIMNIFICAACGSKNTTQIKSNNSNIKQSASKETNTSKDELKDLFQKWDTSTIDDSEKDLIILKFGNYLKSTKFENTYDLKDISENFTIINLGDISAITYIEVPEFYGESGKLSYTWIIYNNTIELIFNCDSKKIEDIFQNSNNEKIYYLIGRDYSITSCTGVFVSRITLENESIQFNNDVIELKSNNTYSKKDGVLYGKSQLTIQKENTDGTQINVRELNDSSSLTLYLTENNSFKG